MTARTTVELGTGVVIEPWVLVRTLTPQQLRAPLGGEVVHAQGVSQKKR